jgi:pyruvate dehydrogenase E2 component (dihydrolipoamide acetyltransferase)
MKKMITEVTIPKLGENIDLVVIERWVKKDGEPVKRGDVLLEINTDKATFEIVSEGNGILKILSNENTEIKTLQAVGAIYSNEEELSEYLKKDKFSEQILSTPSAKRIAKEKNIDLNEISKIIGNKVITEQDVEKYIESKGDKLNPIQKKAILNMQDNYQKMINSTLSLEVDITHLKEKLEEISLKENCIITLNDYIISICAEALKKYGLVNAYFNNEIVYNENIDIGFILDIKDQMLLPVIKNADKLSLREISESSKTLMMDALRNTLAPLKPTFVITNLFNKDIDFFIPIIFKDNSSILGICSPYEKVVKINGELVVRKFMRIVLTFDHRILNGSYMANYLSFIEEKSLKNERVCI